MWIIDSGREAVGPPELGWVEDYVGCIATPDIQVGVVEPVRALPIGEPPGPIVERDRSTDRASAGWTSTPPVPWGFDAVSIVASDLAK
jgi:hypothetical protein